MSLNHVVMSDPGGDPWEEAVCATAEEAQAEVERILSDIAKEGLNPDEWRPLFWIEPRAS